MKIVGTALDTCRIFYVGKRFKRESLDIFWDESLEWKRKDNSNTLSDQSTSNLLNIIPQSNNREIVTFYLSKLPESELKEFFKSRKSLSSIIIPIIINKKFFGFLGVEEWRTERIWSKSEKEFLESLSHNFSSYVEKRIAEINLGKKVEELKKSQMKYKALVQKGSDLVGILDLEGNYKFVSENVTSILGMCPEEYIGKNAFDFIHSDDKNRVIEDFKKLGDNKQIKISAFRFVDSNKNWRWVETLATNLATIQMLKGSLLTPKM